MYTLTRDGGLNPLQFARGESDRNRKRQTDRQADRQEGACMQNETRLDRVDDRTAVRQLRSVHMKIYVCIRGHLVDSLIATGAMAGPVASSWAGALPSRPHTCENTLPAWTHRHDGKVPALRVSLESGTSQVSIDVGVLWSTGGGEAPQTEGISVSRRASRMHEAEKAQEHDAAWISSRRRLRSLKSEFCAVKRRLQKRQLQGEVCTLQLYAFDGAHPPEISFFFSHPGLARI